MCVTVFVLVSVRRVCVSVMVSLLVIVVVIVLGNDLNMLDRRRFCHFAVCHHFVSVPVFVVFFLLIVVVTVSLEDGGGRVLDVDA